MRPRVREASGSTVSAAQLATPRPPRRPARRRQRERPKARSAPICRVGVVGAVAGAASGVSGMGVMRQILAAPSFIDFVEVPPLRWNAPGPGVNTRSKLRAARGDLRPVWQQRVTASVTLCARRDSNPRPSAPEAAPASDHQRWPFSFQALTRVARRPAPASDGPVVTTVVTAGRFSVAVLEQRPRTCIRRCGGTLNDPAGHGRGNDRVSREPSSKIDFNLTPPLFRGEEHGGNDQSAHHWGGPVWSGDRGLCPASRHRPRGRWEANGILEGQYAGGHYP